MHAAVTSTLRARSASLLLVAGLVLTLSPAMSGAAPTPPKNPTDGQLNAVAAQKAALANQVGQLSGQVVALEGQVMQLRAQSELAEQKLADALTKLAAAKDAAVTSKAKVVSAQSDIATAQAGFSQFVHDTYMNGSIGGLTSSILTASDPSALLQRSDYESYIAANQLDAIGSLSRATVAKSNADALARQAVVTQDQLTTAANIAKQNAVAALNAAQDAQARLTAQLASTRTQLAAAQARLYDLNNQRAAYNAYVKKQAAIAAAKAVELRREQLAAQLAAQRARNNTNNSYNPPAPVSIAPRGGGWTQAKGYTAVARARQYLGWPYSYAAGNANGPTYGVAADSDSWNDNHVYGFDCSGLMLYAWGPYLSMAHYAASQYWQAGSFHPSIGQLLPGDMVFWSATGSADGIHHVAIYIGNGNVIQAPYSGAYIEITPLLEVENDYYGATRPLT